MSQLVGLLTTLMTIGIYTLVWQHAALVRLSPSSPWVWVAGLLLYDLCYYWQHRLSHTVALLWAAHVVHHQSEDYNLSTALRQPSTGWVATWAFYLPMAVLGFPPLVFGSVALIDLLYQYWVHTQQIGRLGWFDRWFCAPSNHRVHHAVNDKYLDRNYGGILIVWDRLFGSFQEEDDADPCVYGTRGPLRSWNPVRANLHNYWDMARDSWHAASWSDKLRVWFKHPGWRPPDVAARWPKAPFRHPPGAALRSAAVARRGRRGRGDLHPAADRRHVAALERAHAQLRAAGGRGRGHRGRAVGGGRAVHAGRRGPPRASCGIGALIAFAGGHAARAPALLPVFPGRTTIRQETSP
jgi:sterol desaturase/sphingolipid hydroxylase (fatty acid hydroxylase superfamily)